jgi:FkbM family methyltransferase
MLGRYIMYMSAADTGITPHVCLDGYWESWITLALARAVQPGWHCVDVGANHGYYSVMMAAAVGNEGRVLAVEPNPALSDLLELSLEVNGFSSISRVARVAASEQDNRKARLSVPPGRGLLATMMPDLADPQADVIEVDTMTIDTLTRHWPRVDLVKIDAEGAEELVWAGMAHTLERNPGIVVVLEFTPARYRDPARFVSSIQSAGFALRHVRDDGGLDEVPAAELSCGDRADRWWMLYLARR